MRNHLVIPDAHVKPNQDFSRFDALGKLILDRKPEVIVCIGDFADMESLCIYDKGKKGFSSRSYKEDIKSVQQAMRRLLKPVREYNIKQAKNKKAQYRPKMIMTLGNHEYRIQRAIDQDHVLLEGVISLSDLNFEYYGWEVYPFLEKVSVDGVLYSHYFISGVMGKAIGGEYPAASLIKKQYASCTAGHSHVFDTAMRRSADGRTLRGLVAGCFTEEHEEYAGNANELWRRSVYYKHNVQDGDYELEEITIKRLKEMYG